MKTLEGDTTPASLGAGVVIQPLIFRWKSVRSGLIRLGITLIGLLTAFGIGAILLISVGANPLVAYQALFNGAFGNQFNLLETLVKSTPILLVALGVTFAFRSSTWNIGSEGQLHMGAVGATLAGLALKAWLPDLTPPLAILILIWVGFLFGGGYAAVAGLLKVRWGVNEVITTIMLNFVAVLFVQYLTFGPLRDPLASGQPISPTILDAAQLPRLIARSRLNLGFILACASVILVYVVLWRTTLGYKIRAVGSNPRAARQAGISFSRSVLVAMFISGGLAGLAGTSEIAGLHFRLINSFSPGYGAAGTVVALLAGLHPLAVLPTAILFGGLLTGADTMARTVQVSTSIITVIQGLMVLFVMGSQFLVSKWER